MAAVVQTIGGERQKTQLARLRQACSQRQNPILCTQRNLVGPGNPGRGPIAGGSTVPSVSPSSVRAPSLASSPVQFSHGQAFGCYELHAPAADRKPDRIRATAPQWASTSAPHPAMGSVEGGGLAPPRDRGRSNPHRQMERTSGPGAPIRAVRGEIPAVSAWNGTFRRKTTKRLGPEAILGGGI